MNKNIKFRRRARYALENNLPDIDSLSYYDPNFPNYYWKYDYHFLETRCLRHNYHEEPAYFAALWAGVYAYGELQSELESCSQQLKDNGFTEDAATALVYDLEYDLVGFELDRCAQTMFDIFAVNDGWESTELLGKHTDALTDLDKVLERIRGEVACYVS